jgi:hypothetical protein
MPAERRFAPVSRPSRSWTGVRQTDRAIIEGYRQNPPTTAESAAALASLRDAILEEPW